MNVLSSVIPYLFPLAGNLLGLYLILRRQHRPIRTMLLMNLGASVLFGASIAVKVGCCSAEPALWPMPLVFAPIEYWIKFGPAISAATAAVFIWFKWKPGARP